jgi:hypothetical protein
MKIGPVKIELAEKKPPTAELGATGTTAFGGSLAQEEYNTDLRGSKASSSMTRCDARMPA